MKKSILLSTAMLFSSLSFAVDTVRCPAHIDVEAQPKKVHASSIYSGVPGWLMAQANLKAMGMMSERLKLDSVRANGCYYKGVNMTLNFQTSEFTDPDGDVNLTDRLALKIQKGASQFITYVPVESYSRKGLKLYSNPYAMKVKALLTTGPGSREGQYDMGMIEVSAE